MSGRGPFVLALVAAAAGVVVPSAHGAVLTEGRLLDATGAPSAGGVLVYAETIGEGPPSTALVGHARAAADGSFSVPVTDEAALLHEAGKRDGWVDLVVVADTAARTGDRLHTVRVRRAAGGALVVQRPDDGFRPLTGARAAARTLPPSVTVRADRLRARAFQAPRCRNDRQVIEPVSVRRMAVVGELNNAYNDGTRSIFEYSRGGHASTAFGVAQSHDGGSSFSIESETMISKSGKVTFPAFRRRAARLMRSQFEFTKYQARNNTCAAWDVLIRATSWFPGHNTKKRVRGTLNRCKSREIAGLEPGSSFETLNAKATRFTRAVSVFGVSLTSQSGFNENVKIRHDFRGTRRKHWLCGPDGKQSPFESGRVFSGAR